MFNVSNRYLIVLSIVTISLLSSCGKKEKESREYLSKAKMQYESELYDSALSTLDKLDRNYASELKVRREGLRLRPHIMEKLSLKSLESIDRQLASLMIESEKYKDSLKHVQDAFDGYYTTVELVGKIPAEKSGLYARMTSEGIFTVIASSTRSALSEGVTLTSGGASVSTPKIANDGERNDRSRGVEIINFMASECDTLGSFCADHAGENITLTFNGEKPYSMPLAKEQAEALAKVHAVSKVFTSLRKVQNEKNRLEKQLMISRSQQARSFDESSDND